MDLTSAFRALFALMLVLGLILGLAYGLKRFAPQILTGFSRVKGRKRLEILETLVLDPARRVVIIRVDDDEKLLLLGEGHDLMIAPSKRLESVSPSTQDPAEALFG